MATTSYGAESVSVWWPPAPPHALALSLRLDRQCVPWKRPKPLRGGKRASFIEGEKLHTLYVEIKLWARRYRGNVPPFDGPCEYRLQCGFRPPKDKKLLDRSPHFAMSAGCGDFDNLAKGVADALTGVVWLDDRQVVRHCFQKTYCDKPFLLIEVIELTPAVGLIPESQPKEPIAVRRKTSRVRQPLASSSNGIRPTSTEGS